MATKAPKLLGPLDFPRPDDHLYYEERFPYLSQGDIFAEVPLLLVPSELALVESEVGTQAALVPVLQTMAVIISPTCDFRRPTAQQLAEDPEIQPYTLRQQVVVARIMPFEGWERSSDAVGRTERIRQVKAFDNLRQYMYLPASDQGPQESMVDLGTTWTLPISILLASRRITQLQFTAAQQLSYKLVLYQTTRAVERSGLRPPMD